MLVILTDNTGTIFDRANIKQESLAELNQKAQEATGGNCWWEMDRCADERPQGCSKGCTGRMCRDALHCDAKGRQ